MAIKSIYAKYFQKSKMFLYPLLGIKKGVKIVPSETYIAWDKNIKPEDMKLICLYHPRQKKEFADFKRRVLLKHNRLHKIEPIDSENHLYIFDFADLKDDWFKFLDGKYSRISNEIKSKILFFFPDNSANYVYMRSYLYPKVFFKDYAEILDVNEEFLQSIGELCNKPDFTKETLTQEILQRAKNIN